MKLGGFFDRNANVIGGAASVLLSLVWMAGGHPLAGWFSAALSVLVLADTWRSL